MINKEDILSMELSIDTILVKGKSLIKRKSGLILDGKTTLMEEYNTFDYEIVKNHAECFKEGEFTNGLPQIGDIVIVNKYDAKKIFEDPDEYEEDNNIYKICYYLIKDTNVQAFIKKGE